MFQYFEQNGETDYIQQQSNISDEIDVKRQNLIKRIITITNKTLQLLPEQPTLSSTVVDNDIKFILWKTNVEQYMNTTVWEFRKALDDYHTALTAAIGKVWNSACHNLYMIHFRATLVIPIRSGHFRQQFCSPYQSCLL